MGLGSLHQFPRKKGASRTGGAKRPRSSNRRDPTNWGYAELVANQSKIHFARNDYWPNWLDTIAKRFSAQRDTLRIQFARSDSVESKNLKRLLSTYSGEAAKIKNQPTVSKLAQFIIALHQSHFISDADHQIAIAKLKQTAEQLNRPI